MNKTYIAHLDDGTEILFFVHGNHKEGFKTTEKTTGMGLTSGLRFTETIEKTKNLFLNADPVATKNLLASLPKIPDQEKFYLAMIK